MNNKRKSALLITVVMLFSCFTGCKTNDKNDVTDTNTSEVSIAEGTVVCDSSGKNYFGDDYDPFAEDYNPYGDNNALKSSFNVQTNADGTPVTDTPNNDITIPQTQTTASYNDNICITQVTTTKSGSNTSEASSSDVTLILNTANGWENGSDKYVQLDGIVKNKQSKELSGWTATITVSKDTRIDQFWNCEIKLDGNTMTVTPVEHNKNISSNGEGTFGMILCNAGTIDTSKAKITYGTSSSAASGNNNSNNGNNNNSNNSSVGNNNHAIAQAKDVPAPTTDDWLFVNGNKIVDINGKEVWLTGVNWFGYNTGTNTFDGLWACDLNTSLTAIADRGFNLLRIPISTELIKEWSNGNYPSANFNQATNSYLVGMNSLEIFDYVIGQCHANGIKIMIDIHSAKTDSMGHMYNVWYNGNISEKDYLNALTWIAKRYAKDDTIIAYDLKNEPHGKEYENPRAKWDNSTDSDNWKYIAEKAAKAVFSGNPNALVMVEGIEIYPKDIKKNGNFKSTNSGDYYYNWWGGNLRGVKDNPVDLGSYQNKLVYSPHDYGPTVYEQPWFKGNYTFDSLYKDCWYDNWFYIQKEGIAPLLIGEWGGYMREPNLTWMTHLRKLIKDNKINHIFWCFNSNSGDTGGLVLDDFTTWDEEKYKFVKEVLWQQNGKFVGLDHEIPLGKNGITLTDAK